MRRPGKRAENHGKSNNGARRTEDLTASLQQVGVVIRINRSDGEENKVKRIGYAHGVKKQIRGFKMLFIG